jgi:hypothetical protein
MRWRRAGLILERSRLPAWAATSALQPTPLVDDRRVRVYAGFRDAEGRSRVGYADLDPDDPTRVLAVSQVPALDLGAPGCFDRDGVVPCAAVSRGGEIWLYYAGYLRGEGAQRFTVFGGLAISRDGGETFVRDSEEAVMGPTHEARLFRVAHSVLPTATGWRVWYGAGGEFRTGETKTLPVYDIRYCDSPDGRSFPGSGTVCITPHGSEHRVGRPFVVADKSGYRMFYGAGSESVPYELRYAESADGDNWRDCSDQLGLERTPGEWDGAMMAYPALIEVDGAQWLLYNGDDYGREGFGGAQLLAA